MSKDKPIVQSVFLPPGVTMPAAPDSVTTLAVRPEPVVAMSQASDFSTTLAVRPEPVVAMSQASDFSTTLAVRPEPSIQPSGADNVEEQQVEMFFGDGAWLPALEPLEMGAQNYETLQNLRPSAKKLEGILGCTGISNSPPVFNDTVSEVLNGASYAEVDNSSRISRAATTITMASMPRSSSEFSIAYRDFGEGFFRGNIEIRFRFNIASVNTATNGAAIFCALSNSITGSPYDSFVAGLDTIAPYVYYDGSNCKIGMLAKLNSVTYTATVLVGANHAVNTTYYGKLQAVTVYVGGVYYTYFYFYTYSVSSYSSTVDYAYISAIQPFGFRYMFPVASYNNDADGAAKIISGTASYFYINEDVSLLNANQYLCDRTTPSHIYAQVEDEADATTVMRLKTTPPGTGSFESTADWTDGDGAGLGRFATGPGESILYANGVESCIASGDEADVAAAFVVSPISVTISASVTASYSTSETITLGAGNWVDYGFKVGMKITVSGSTNNDGTYTIITLAAGVLTTIEAIANTAGPETSGTITALSHHVKDVVDVTEALQNSLSTEGNVADVVGTALGLNIKLYCKFNEGKGSLTSTDSANTPGIAVTMTPGGSGTCTLESHSKFGASSVYVRNPDPDPGTSSAYFSVPDSANYDFAANPFSVDFWVYRSAGRSIGGFLRYKGASKANDYMSLYYVGSTGILNFKVISGGATRISLSVAATIPAAAWNHIAVIGGWGGTASTIALCVNGVALTTGTITTGVPADYDSTLSFGMGYDGSADIHANAYFDEVVVVTGAARWTANFTPPTEEIASVSASTRSASTRRLLLMTTRPADAFKHYIKTANATASTMTGMVFTGSEFIEVGSLSDGTKPSTISLAKTGTVTFTSTDGTAKPMHFLGLYLYAYLFYISAGQATIYQTTARLPFQTMKDTWDGVSRTCVKAVFYDQSADAFLDYTVDVNEPSYTSMVFGMPIGLMTTSDYILLGFTERLTALQIDMVQGSVNTNASIATVSYWNGTAWTAVSNSVNGTYPDAASKTFNRSGLISWEPPTKSAENPQFLQGVSGYFYKITVSAALSGTAATSIYIDLVYGVPAQLEVMPAKFVSRFANRAVLGGFITSGESNRMDYSASNAPTVWNGDETSNDGSQSLYFGGPGAIIAATEIFNRFNSEVYTFLLVFKNNATYMLSGDGPENFVIFDVSKNIGCPAPLTLCVAEIFGESNRQAAFWLSADGPVVFDGAVINIIPGVENFFDPGRTSDCINHTYIEKAVGWYDSVEREANFVFPHGSNTVNSKWLVFNLREKKWYEVVPHKYPTCAFPVHDTTGRRYIYAGVSGGYLMRMNNGNTFDGASIAWSVKTGALAPFGSFTASTMRRLRLIAGTLSESATVTGTVYNDSLASSLTPISAQSLTTTRDYSKLTEAIPSVAIPRMSYQVGFAGSVSSSGKSLKLLKWAATIRPEREDLT